MSTDEIVLEIQNGNDELVTELWERTKRFIAYKARSAILIMGQSASVEVDDLIQSGYFALVAAVKSYKPGSGDFIGWLSLFIRFYSGLQKLQTEK